MWIVACERRGAGDVAGRRHLLWSLQALVAAADQVVTAPRLRAPRSRRGGFGLRPAWCRRCGYGRDSALRGGGSARSRPGACDVGTAASLPITAEAASEQVLRAQRSWRRGGCGLRAAVRSAPVGFEQGKEIVAAPSPVSRLWEREGRAGCGEERGRGVGVRGVDAWEARHPRRILVIGFDLCVLLALDFNIDKLLCAFS